VKYFAKQNVLKYLYDQLTGNFAGFVIGMSATGLVSRFFETRGLRNLWGLSSKKVLVSKEMFGALEWIISIVIGFIVFEIMTRVIKDRLDRFLRLLKIKFWRWIASEDLRSRYATVLSIIHNKRIVFFTGVNSAVRNTFSRFSRRD
jgi:hypothetical protein